MQKTHEIISLHFHMGCVRFSFHMFVFLFGMKVSNIISSHKFIIHISIVHALSYMCLWGYCKAKTENFIASKLNVLLHICLILKIFDARYSNVSFIVSRLNDYRIFATARCSLHIFLHILSFPFIWP